MVYNEEEEEELEAMRKVEDKASYMDKAKIIRLIVDKEMVGIELRALLLLS